MEDVDTFAAHPRQAAFQRRCHGIGYVAELGARQPDFCADDDIGGLDIAQDAAEIPFRLAIAV
jgi:hypothetical protein